MKMKELFKDKRKLIIVGIVVLAVILAIILVVTVRSNSMNTKYENYMDTAEEYMTAENYGKAVSYYERAFDVKDTDECAIALARAYAANGDYTQAEELLLAQIENSKGSAESTLKNVLKEIRAMEDANNTPVGVMIGGELYSEDATAIILHDTHLTADDTAAIATFTDLATLSLKNCGLEDISFIYGLTELTSLNLSGNDISDLTPLKKLNSLRTLYLDENPIEDFSPLYNLHSLTTLSIKGIEITDNQYEELEEELPKCSIFSDDTVADTLTLGGVEFQTDVTELDLSNKGITDISDLAECTQLQTLNLKGNDISDLTPLESLENLTWLCLWDNDIKDVSPLGTLTQLTYLDLEDNEITNINALSSLTNLTELYIDGNDIGRFNALSSMNNLKKLGLRDTGLTDSDLELLKKSTLTELEITENEELTSKAVEALKAAIPNCKVIHDELSVAVTIGSKTFDSEDTFVDASNAGATDISEITKFTGLTGLILNGNPISDFSPISSMKDLTVLELRGTGLTGTGSLSGLTKLTNLNLGENDLKDVYVLSTCTQLTELILTGNTNLTDIAPLSYCTNLTDLYLDNTGVTDVSALASLPNLTNLYLDGCALSDFSQLTKLTSLKHLYVSDCGLSQQDINAISAELPGCTIYAG